MTKNKDLLDKYKSMKDRKRTSHATKVVPDKKKIQKNKRSKVSVDFDKSFDFSGGGSSGE